MRRRRPFVPAVVTALAVAGTAWLVLVDRHESISPELGPAVQVRIDTATSQVPSQGATASGGTSAQERQGDPAAAPPADPGTGRTASSSGATTVPRHAPAPAGDDQDDDQDDDVDGDGDPAGVDDQDGDQDGVDDVDGPEVSD